MAAARITDEGTDESTHDPGVDEEGTTKRLIHFTDRAEEQFYNRVTQYEKKLLDLWNKVEVLLKNIDPECYDLNYINESNKTLCLIYAQYRLTCKDFVNYLSRTRSVQGEKCLDEHEVLNEKRTLEVDSVFKTLDEAKDRLEAETRSIASSSSSKVRDSRTSVHTSIRSENAKTRLFYAEREANLKKERALIVEEELLSRAKVERKRMELQADLELLKEQKLCAEVEADISNHSDNQSVELSVPRETTHERTRRYIEDNFSASQGESDKSVQKSMKTHNFGQNEQLNKQTHVTHSVPENVPLSVSIATEFSKYLAKKDLLFSRLVPFSDSPEKYVVWKSDFLQIIREIGVSHSEELDLLVKWLGPESSKQAECIKAANTHDPAAGLVKLWKRLDERYGSPELVVASLKRKLSVFTNITTKDYKRLYELSDLLTEVDCAMNNKAYSTVLSYFNSTTGVNPIVQKLPYHLQNRWTVKATDYMKTHSVAFPPFQVFCEFIHEMSSILNNPCFIYEDKSVKDKSKTSKNHNRQQTVSSFKTEIHNQSTEGIDSVSKTETCLYHDVKGHTLNQCKTFRGKPFNIRKKFFRDKNLCFKCGVSSDHTAKVCKETMKCQVCGNCSHPTALHMNGGESSYTNYSNNQPNITAACTKVCGQMGSVGKSCAKIVLVTVHSRNRPSQTKRVYALIDDQSNRSLAKTEFFDAFQEPYGEVQYALSSCAGVVNASGRRTKADDFIVSSLDGSSSLQLPALTECNQIPALVDEIPTPNSARPYSHLADVASNIPPIDHSAEILLLIGRDLPEAHFVYDQRTGPRGSPYAQKLNLGWVVVGETCLGKVHQPMINVKKTFVHEDGKASLFPECKNRFSVKDIHKETEIGSTVFQTCENDERRGMSIEDKEFLGIMATEFKKDTRGYWTAPLPFHSTRPKLPNNRNMAINRTRTLVATLRKNPTKQSHFIQFMQKMIDNGHAEVAPPLTSEAECWYLPVFGIYHPKKPSQIRVVFDSSAKYMGLSLNGVLMTGPDLNNSMLGVLLRFRREPVAISADIQQMFYQFFVQEKDRDYLRFFWFKDNNPNKAIIEYRMCVHVFGNSPSPSIATYGLRESARSVESVYGTDVTKFVSQNFYVDDGLTSLPSPAEAIDLLERTQKALACGGNLRLHKVSSNSREVMNAFPKDDLNNELKDLDIGQVELPTQRSLGLNWNLECDKFTFVISKDEKPCTRRGILSVLNSLFDPLGFVSPVVVHGRIIMRDMMIGSPDWDEPLPVETRDKWTKWCESLKHLENLKIPRTYLDGSLQDTVQQEVHVFSDASERAISSVAYLRTKDVNGEMSVGFIIGKSKVSPKHGHTIPRLELCAAVMAVELADIISDHLHLPIENMRFYSDSRVVLGYLCNRVRRFHVYVENRVSKILKRTMSNQWSHVVSKENPADLGTRPTPAECLQDSIWLKGPSFLFSENTRSDEVYNLQVPEQDPEVRQETCLKTNVIAQNAISTSGFENVSRWERLVNAIVVWKRLLRRRYNAIHSVSDPIDSPVSDLQTCARTFIFSTVQQEVYRDEIHSIQRTMPISKKSPIVGLNPFVDEDGLLRVGGRLQHSDLKVIEKNPIILPGRHWVSKLLVYFYHEQVKHQGRQFTEGAIRSAGFWITGVKRLIGSIIHHCVKCQKLRGSLGFQKMSDLPEDRLVPGPPFTSVGLDCFGPWEVTSRRTRGGAAKSKRWAVLFTCLTSRAVHIEVIEELSSSSFINALRRFTSIRGKAKLYRSDRGTNFIGALDDLGVNVSVGVKQYLDREGATWLLNPPHSSHRGGVWERMIGVTRRILDSLLLDIPGGGLTHEVLVTFMSEVSAIVNSRPLVPLSADCCNPIPLSPSLLLTQKSDCIVDVVIPSDIKDMYKAQWKRVQILSEQFWNRWRSEFLQTLQIRRKWTSEQRELKTGDVVLLRDKQTARNSWPMGLIVSVSLSKDNLVRTAEVRVIGNNGKSTVYERPVSEMVVLIPS